MATQTEIREQVTQKIVEALKAGTAPWRRPWSNTENTGSPANVISKKNYSGVNNLLLQLVSMERGISSRWWATFRQWQELGLRIKPRPSHVKPGEWGTRIVFMKPVTKKISQAEEIEDRDSDSATRESRFFMLRQFTIFSAEQVEGNGIEKYLAESQTSEPFAEFTGAEDLVAATEARILFGSNQALYRPTEDVIQLPPKESFSSQKEYYSTALHELVHWTGHESRLARLNKFARFGSHAYAVEELVAEMGASFLCNEVGVPQSDDLSNQAAYLASWLKVLQADSSAIFTAASQASKACDFILAFSRPASETREEVEPELVGAIGGNHD